MQLFGYNDPATQGLHLSGAIPGLTLIGPGGPDTHPIWLALAIPDACICLRIPQEAQLTVCVGADAVVSLDIGACTVTPGGVCQPC